MNKPAFQFYPSDFIMGTSFMTAEEVGGYMRLLCYQWTNGFIPNKPALIKQLTGVFDDNAIEEILKKFSDNGSGGLINLRLESTRSNYEQFLNKQSINGKKGGRPSKEINPNQNPNETQTKPNENPKPNPNDNPKESSSPSPSPSPSSLSINSKGEKESFSRSPAWWVSANKEVVTQKVMLYNNAYPIPFLQTFIDYYCQPHIHGGISINHEMKFDIESKLRKWYSDPKTKEQFPQPKQGRKVL